MTRPGIQDNVLPPEVLVRPTEVIEHGAPEMNVVEPNASGTLGNAVVHHEDLWRAGLDPLRSVGGNPMTTQGRAVQGYVRRLQERLSVSQANELNILEYEGGSEVVYHEPTRDDQLSNVQGMAVSGAPRQIEAELTHAHPPVQQHAPVSIVQSRRMLERVGEGMPGPLRKAFTQVLIDQGAGAAESFVNSLTTTHADEVAVSTDSGVVMSSGDRDPVFNRVALQRGKEQRQKSALRPAARFHPAQSGYSSSGGQYATSRGNMGSLPGGTPPPQGGVVGGGGGAAASQIPRGKWIPVPVKLYKADRGTQTSLSAQALKDLNKAIAALPSVGKGSAIKAAFTSGNPVYWTSKAVPGAFYLEMPLGTEGQSLFYGWAPRVAPTTQATIFGDKKDNPFVKDMAHGGASGGMSSPSGDSSQEPTYEVPAGTPMQWIPISGKIYSSDVGKAITFNTLPDLPKRAVLVQVAKLNPQIQKLLQESKYVVTSSKNVLGIFHLKIKSLGRTYYFAWYPKRRPDGTSPELNPLDNGTGQDEDCSTIMGDGSIVYHPCGDPPYIEDDYMDSGPPDASGEINWVPIAVGVAAVGVVAYFATRKM